MTPTNCPSRLISCQMHYLLRPGPLKLLNLKPVGWKNSLLLWKRYKYRENQRQVRQKHHVLRNLHWGSVKTEDLHVPTEVDLARQEVKRATNAENQITLLEFFLQSQQYQAVELANNHIIFDKLEPNWSLKSSLHPLTVAVTMNISMF